MNSHIMQPPRAVGLYDPSYEHDACGVGMVARLDNRPTHEVVSRAITALENLEHRGASGADPRTGDGAGILMQMPDELLRAVVDFELPPLGSYGVLMCFLPTDDAARGGPGSASWSAPSRARGSACSAGATCPSTPTQAGEVAGACRPVIRQLFVGAGPAHAGGDAAEGDQDAFERKLYVIRRVCELNAEHPGLYVTSSSSRTINYKGMLISFQLAAFYPDLRDERTKSALALVHSRFSTNTFPSWELAHPYRVICHNGEINTVRGNVNWMRARESELRSELFGEDLEKILPVVSPGNSDSATFDNVLELLMLGGRSLPHAAMMMIPEAYRKRDDLPEDLKGFYAFHSCLMEPWDGPASVAFTDGRVVGATLDRNGLRPGRWVETTDGHVVLGSEIGLLDIPPRAGPPPRAPAAGQAVPRRPRARTHRRGRGGQARGRPRASPTASGTRATPCRSPSCEPSDQVTLSDQPLRTAPARVRLLPGGPARAARADGARRRRAGRLDGQRPLAGRALRPGAAAVLLLQAAVRAGHQPADRPDPRGDRDEPGDEPGHPSATCSKRRPSTRTSSCSNSRSCSTASWRRCATSTTTCSPRARSTSTWPLAGGRGGHERGARAHLPRSVTKRSTNGVNIIVLSDRLVGPRRVPIPSLLAVAAVHHHLVREGTRLRAGIILESGEPREVHHFATLIGYGASAINPYLMLETLDDLVLNQRAIKRAGPGRRGACSWAPWRRRRTSSRRSAKGC